MPQFIFFDLGNVLVNFDPQIAVDQVARVLGTDPNRVQKVMYDSGLELKLESGALSEQEFLDELFSKLQAQAPREKVLEAMSAMFSVNVGIIPVIARLITSGVPLGILSNTCGPHWNWLAQQNFGITRSIGQPAVLSYEVGCLKPEAPIYHAAAERACVSPHEILFVDDRPENVEGAKDCGWDAILFTDATTLVKDLRHAGIKCFI